MSSTLERLRQSQPPSRFPVRNQGGIAEPTAPPSPRGKPVAEKPVARSRQSSIQRPVTSPSMAKPPAVSQAGTQATDERSVFRDVLRQNARAGMPPPPPPGAAPETEGDAIEQVVDRAQMELGRQETAQDLRVAEKQSQAQQEAELQKEDATSPSYLERQETKAEERRVRRAVPSPIEGIPQGTYDDIVNQEPPGDFSPEQKKQFKEDAELQLREYGDYPGKGDPSAPAPPIRPGKRSFNPFSGKFSGEKGPNGFQLMGIDMNVFKQAYFKNQGGR